MTELERDDLSVASLFDKMADEYDTIVDPWFDHLYDRLNEIIDKVLDKHSKRDNMIALDVGSGTGFQSFMFAKRGYETIGFDISKGLTTVAISKSEDNVVLRNKLSFCLASATQIPFKSQKFDLVNCCGSVLSLITNYEVALREMCRVLKPGGIIILEVEQKWNFDAFWMLLSSVSGDLSDTKVHQVNL